MSLTVQSAFVDEPLEVLPLVVGDKVIDGVFEHKKKTVLYGIAELRGRMYQYFFEVEAGYIGNFASSPNIWIVQKIVPSYVVGDPVYNTGFDLHDWLYSTCGACTSGQVLDRSEVDDFARGIMRCSPTLAKNRNWVARLRCSIMDLSVDLFAGHKRHWGNDSYGSRGFAKLNFVEIPKNV